MKWRDLPRRERAFLSLANIGTAAFIFACIISATCRAESPCDTTWKRPADFELIVRVYAAIDSLGTEIASLREQVATLRTLLFFGVRGEDSARVRVIVADSIYAKYVKIERPDPGPALEVLGVEGFTYRLIHTVDTSNWGDSVIDTAAVDVDLLIERIKELDRTAGSHRGEERKGWWSNARD